VWSSRLRGLRGGSARGFRVRFWSRPHVPIQ
jgi:hypothetical protein